MLLGDGVTVGHGERKEDQQDHSTNQRNIENGITGTGGQRSQPSAWVLYCQRAGRSRDRKFQPTIRRSSGAPFPGSRRAIHP